ncbi:MAG: hypothetical protein A2312_04250 [Candidatus Staskawiczbacteria bacterium RIFOXYB2_FULL_32_9]|nr:MAG: hypothetical protein UR22_C0009G0055 [Parcubacteria group bacterium GW2011_GWC2_32_10]OGZ78566.1 MAG: hypothetical protein A2360_04370 [Candidatus Staskawiczbacteria bacterium RIFOXYB1_FULL_32_11]OGZ82631.1 MAG: hypothetical protein A2312_04250 [Candidatus Staskawiczbacteria bacterium RIFOXYB2_FULL_32_9]
MLSDKAREAFKKIYKEEFKEEISDEQAEDLGFNLLTLFSYIYKPVKQEWVDKLDKENKEKQKTIKK